jgi:hypothetical protein
MIIRYMLCLVLIKDSQYLKHYMIKHIYIHAHRGVYNKKHIDLGPTQEKKLHEHTKLAIYMNMKSKTSLGLDHIIGSYTDATAIIHL